MNLRIDPFLALVALMSFVFLNAPAQAKLTMKEGLEACQRACFYSNIAGKSHCFHTHGSQTSSQKDKCEAIARNTTNWCNEECAEKFTHDDELHISNKSGFDTCISACDGGKEEGNKNCSGPFRPDYPIQDCKKVVTHIVKHCYGNCDTAFLP